MRRRTALTIYHIPQSIRIALATNSKRNVFACKERSQCRNLQGLSALDHDHVSPDVSFRELQQVRWSRWIDSRLNEKITGVFKLHNLCIEDL